MVLRPYQELAADFLYESEGSKYKLSSLGADNKVGGEGNDKDLASDDL